MTIMSNIFVYVCTYLLLRLDISLDDNPRQQDYLVDLNLTRDDAPKFMYLTIIVCIVGAAFQVIFHVGTNEKRCLSDEQIQQQSHSLPNSFNFKLDWLGYLKSSRFYIVASLFVCTRLILNLTQVYLPMYLTDTLELDKV
jgi:Na+/melibiose symporter-like transporter